MKNRLKIGLIAALLLVGCHTKQLSREKQQYDVVQEGSASSDSTTVGAPGETAPLAETSPITGTNVDTTTAFAITTGDTAAQPLQPGTLASTLTADSGGRMSTPPIPDDGANRGTRRPRMTPSTSTGAPPPTSTAPATTTTVAPSPPT